MHRFDKIHFQNCLDLAPNANAIITLAILHTIVAYGPKTYYTLVQVHGQKPREVEGRLSTYLH